MSHTNRMYLSTIRAFSTAICMSSLVALACPSARADDPPPTPTRGVEDDELLVGRADKYSDVVDQAVGFLVRGDAVGFRSMLSEATIASENRGAGTIDTIIKSRFIPFFSEFVRLTDTVSTMATHDAGNNPGLAICRTFETTSGQERPFVVYVINQGGYYVVGNLLINKTFEELKAENPKGR